MSEEESAIRNIPTYTAEVDKLKGYDNLAAMMQGCVSGHSTEWPLLRVEMKRLLDAHAAAIKQAEARYVDRLLKGMYIRHHPQCLTVDRPMAICTCGLSKLLVGHLAQERER